MRKIFTAIITPFLNKGEIDYQSFKHLLKRQEEAENGVLILGSTGENLSFSLQEKKDLVNFTLEQNLSIPLMIGVGGVNLNESKEWVSFLNESANKIDSLLLTTPMYCKPMRFGQTTWFKEIMDHSKIKCLFYNHPGRSSIALNKDSVKDLLHHPQFYGIKESSGSIQVYQEFAKIFHESNRSNELALFGGDDPFFHEHMKFRCEGLISVASNLWPQEMNLVVTSEDLSMNREALVPFYEALFKSSNPIPVKVISSNLGLISTSTLRTPLSNLDFVQSKEESFAFNKSFLEKIKRP